jgi:hypothetical protein
MAPCRKCGGSDNNKKLVVEDERGIPWKKIRHIHGHGHR